MTHGSSSRASLLLAGTALLVAMAAPAWPQARHDHSGLRPNLAPLHVQATNPAPQGHEARGHGAQHAMPPAAAPATASAPARTELGGQVRDLPRGAAAPTSDATPALIDTLGTLSWPAGTASREAQAYFDQGYRLAWAFNHAEAARAFRAAQALDPDCAMCLWGEAWVLGPHVNFFMEQDANRRALAALEQARRLAPRAGGMRAALIEALSQRYSADPAAERKALDQAFADAMRGVQARFPADTEIAVLTADALMNLQPWDYWEDAGRRPKGATAEIVTLLEGVLGDRATPVTPNPLHPGAIHLYIHTVEASDRPERAAPHAARLGALMPGAGHIVHMPAHIWYRLGQWRESLEANLRAVAADEAQLARGGASPLYAGGYFARTQEDAMTPPRRRAGLAAPRRSRSGRRAAKPRPSRQDTTRGERPWPTAVTRSSRGCAGSTRRPSPTWWRPIRRTRSASASTTPGRRTGTRTARSAASIRRWGR